MPSCTGLIVAGLIVAGITTALLISRITTLIATLIAILLIITGVGLLPGIVPHLLAVVKVLAVSLDELVGFASCKASQNVFGHGVVFSDT